MKDFQTSWKLLGALAVLLVMVKADRLRVRIGHDTASKQQHLTIFYNNYLSDMTTDPNSESNFYHTYADNLNSEMERSFVTEDKKNIDFTKIKFQSRGWKIDKEGKLELITNKDTWFSQNEENLEQFKLQKISAPPVLNAQDCHFRIDKESKEINQFWSEKNPFALCWKFEIEFSSDIKILYTYPKIDYEASADPKTKITLYFIAVEKKSPPFAIAWSNGLLDVHSTKKSSTTKAQKYQNAYEVLVVSQGESQKPVSLILTPEDLKDNQKSYLWLFTSDTASDICDLINADQRTLNPPIDQTSIVGDDIKFLPKVYNLGNLQFPSVPTEFMFNYQIPGLKGSPSNFGRQISVEEPANHVILVANYENTKPEVASQIVDYSKCQNNPQSFETTKPVGIQLRQPSQRMKKLI